MTKTPLSERLGALESEAESAEELAAARSYPPGWAPGVVFDGATGVGTITTGGLTTVPNDWSDLLRARGMDPEIYEVVGDTISWCSWDGWARGAQGEDAVSAMQASYRAQIRRKRLGVPDINVLYQEIRKNKAPKKAPPTGDATLVVALADWQIGNGDQPLERQVEALGEIGGLVNARAKELRKMGRTIGTVCIAGIGDLVENCAGFYSNQPNAVILDRREQNRLVRRALRDIVIDVAPTFEKVVVTAVGGNHGQNRQGGKPVTGPNDNDDVAVLETVAEVISMNEDAYSHVGFRIPNERLAVSLNLSNTLVAFTHGHLNDRGSRGYATKKLWDWWTHQAMGRHYPGVADAQVLVAGHYHHHCIKFQAGRHLLLCPSLLNYSQYFGDATGNRTEPGTMTFVVNDGLVSDLQILHPTSLYLD